MAYQKKTYTPVEPVVRIPFRPKYKPAEEQKDIFSEKKFGDSNIHVDAGPGCGKTATTTWAMTIGDDGTGCCLSLGKEIVKTIEPNCAPHIECGTAHKFGLRAVVSMLRGRRPMVDTKGAKLKGIFTDSFPSLDPYNISGSKKSAAFSFMYDVLNLVDKMRLNLREEYSESDIVNTCIQYNINFDTEKFDDVKEMIPIIFRKCLEKTSYIDFTDMMWIPIRLNLDVPQFDTMYVDERQDLNSLMIEYIVRMTKGRIMTVGDKFQSIYGFGGADAKATERLLARFPGKEFPLKTCYRCAKSIVDKINTIYPGLKAFEGNGDGEVLTADEIDYNMPDGSMILARRKAALVKPCFALLRQGRKAVIKGKDIGEGLIRTIESLKAADAMDLVFKTEEFRDKKIGRMMERQDVSQSKIEDITDEANCIIEIASSCKETDEVISKIKIIFDESVKGIMLSSIHRSKGLESDEVTIIDYNRVRLCHERMTDDDHVQEKNLEYVALSRAKNKLTLVG